MWGAGELLAETTPHGVGGRGVETGVGEGWHEEQGGGQGRGKWGTRRAWRASAPH